MDFLAIIALGISLYTLNKISKIESRLGGNPLFHVDEKLPPLPTPPATPSFITEPVIKQKTSTEKSSLEKLWAWYVHEWPLKTGALFIILGFVWLVSYAFLNNWVGPTGRITFGFITSLIILYFGERRLRSIQSQGVTLIGLGASVAVITVYAAQSIYHMFPSIVALGFVTLIMILVATISLKHKVLSLAVVSVIIGGLAPLVIGSTEKNIFDLYSYLLSITIGVVWIARYSKWRILTFVNLVIIALYSMSYFFSSASSLQSALTPTEFFELQFFAVTFSSIFFFSTLAALITNKETTHVDLITSMAVGFFTLGFINGLVSEEYKSMVCLLTALFYSVASYLVFIQTKLQTAIYIYTGIAIFLLAIATTYEFDGPLLIIAFSLQALILPIIGSGILGSTIGKRFLYYFAVPFVLSLSSLSEYAWSRQDGLWQDSFYSLTAITTALIISGVYFYYKYRTDKETHTISLFLIITGTVYALIWIWRVLDILLTPEYIAIMVSLLIFAVIGLCAYLIGEMQNRKIVNKFGLSLLIFVIGRLLLVEVWNMELSTRIITFFLVGLLLIGSVLLRKNRKAGAVT